MKIFFYSLIINIFANKKVEKKMEYILTIDIGNTRAKYAVFEDDKLICTDTFNPYSNDLKDITKKYPLIKKVILSSVGGKIEECRNQLKNFEIITLSGETPLPFKLKYKDRSQVGSDRLVAVAAAMAEKPNQNNLIIDIGTCITYDILTSDNYHLCGPISPGINLRFKAMNDYTALLPLCKPSNDEVKIICNSTEECLHAGVIGSISFEIEGFIKSYSNIYDNLNVFIIGGDNIFFENKLKNCIFADANFTFNGLRYILNYQ